MQDLRSAHDLHRRRHGTGLPRRRQCVNQEAVEAATPARREDAVRSAIHAVPSALYSFEKVASLDHLRAVPVLVRCRHSSMHGLDVGADAGTITSAPLLPANRAASLHTFAISAPDRPAVRRATMRHACCLASCEAMGVRRRCTAVICSLPRSSGRGTTTFRDSRPGRVNAASNTCTRCMFSGTQHKIAPSSHLLLLRTDTLYIFQDYPESQFPRQQLYLYLTAAALQSQDCNAVHALIMPSKGNGSACASGAHLWPVGGC